MTTTTARRRRPAALIAAGAALLLLAACAPEASTPTPEPDPTYSSDYVEPARTVTAPLRGTQVEAGSLDHPSLAAKIDNHEAAWPQIGLERADIVFEELVEGGITRYVAVWHSDVPEQIGPVRSIRPMDPDIASAFGGIIAYSGGQQRYVALMQAAPVLNAVHGSGADDAFFSRTSSKPAPHNVVVDAPGLIAAHDDLAAPGLQFAYSADTASATATKEGAPTSRLDLTFSNARSPSWAWDAGSERFLRSQNGAADMDANGAQLGAVNVVTVRVPITMLDVPKTELVGEGPALISTGGGTVEATWVKRSATDRIRLVDAYGLDVRLAPGNTWIELVPTSGSTAVVAP